MLIPNLSAPSALLRSTLALFRPRPALTPACAAALTLTPTAPFSASASLQKRNKRVKREPKITQLRYFLSHGVQPRPLRFSRNRALRHWTIHRAWRLYQTKLRLANRTALEKQFQSMNLACEKLRHMDSYGFTAEERDALGAPLPPGEVDDTGRLFRVAMLKHGSWRPLPIEYARIQTDTPAREPWAHDWRR